MKNLKSLSILIIAVLLAFPTFAQLNASHFEQLGNAHNEGLTFAFQRLQKENLTAKNVEQMLNNIMDDYYRTTFTDPEAEDDAIQASHDIIKQILLGGTTGPVNPFRSVIDRNKGKFTSGQLLYLNQCESVIRELDLFNLNPTIEALRTIQSKAKSRLNNDEILIIYNATEIGIASANYWSKEMTKWQAVGSRSKSKTANRTSDCCGPGLVGADVAGGVGAAVTTAIVNAVPGAGQIAWGSAIVGGAAGASVAYAVSSWWDSVFGK